MNKNNTKLTGLNVIIIGVISVLYVLMITKLAEIISLGYDEPDVQIETYVMIIYFISIIGIICGYLYLNDTKSTSNTKTPNWIIRWSLSIGGVILLIYTITNYWDHMSDYYKLILIALSITCIIYYLYQLYES
jgi:hypothetical protein